MPQRRQRPSQLEISARGLLARWIPTDLNASLPEPESVFRTPEQIRAELAARGISADFAAELINGMGSSGNGLDAPTTHPSATPIPSDPTTLNLAVPPQRIELVRNAAITASRRDPPIAVLERGAALSHGRANKCQGLGVYASRTVLTQRRHL